MLDTTVTENLIRLLYNTDAANAKTALAILSGRVELPKPLFHALLVVRLYHLDKDVRRAAGPVFRQFASESLRQHLKQHWKREFRDQFRAFRQSWAVRSGRGNDDRGLWDAALLNHPNLDAGEFFLQINAFATATALKTASANLSVVVRDIPWSQLPADAAAFQNVTKVVLGREPTAEPDEARLGQFLRNLPGLKKIGLFTDQHTFAVDEVRLSEAFIRAFLKQLGWANIARVRGLPEAFMEEFAGKLNWDYLSQYQSLSDDFMKKHQKRLSWGAVSQYQTLSPNALREFADRLDWNLVSQYQRLSPETIRTYVYRLDWSQFGVRYWQTHIGPEFWQDYAHFDNETEFRTLPEDQIRPHPERFDWWRISTYTPLSENFIRAFQDKLNWPNIARYQRLSEAFVKEFSHKWPKEDTFLWETIAYSQELSVPFLRSLPAEARGHDFYARKRLDEATIRALVDLFPAKPAVRDWAWAARYQPLSEAFIEEFWEKLHRENVQTYQRLSDGFMRRHRDELDWRLVSEHQRLSESFIREMRDYVHWNVVSFAQPLSEAFIREFAEKVRWDYLARQPKLSETFMAEFADRLDWREISAHQPLSDEAIERFTDRLDWFELCRKPRSEAFIRRFGQKITETENWYSISLHSQLSEAFLREFADKIHWKILLKRTDLQLSDEFRAEFDFE